MQRNRAERTLVGATVAWAVLHWASCAGEGGPSEWDGAVRDSAGVVIVEGHGEDRVSQAWGTPRADLVLGEDPAREETVFGFVADVAVAGDGRMFVLDQHAAEVRVFDASGAHVGTIGGPGEGPGELSRFAGSLILRSETLMVVDWGRARVHRFGLDGTFLDSPSLPGQGGARSWWSQGADGSLFFRTLTRYTDEEGRWQGADILFRMSETWEEPDTVLTFEYAQADLGGRGNPRLPLVVNAPFWTVRSDGSVAWGTLESAEIRIHDADAGALRRIVRRRAWDRRPSSEGERLGLADIMRDKMRMLGGSPDAVDQLPVDYPDRLPALTSVLAGPDGSLLVQRMGLVSDVHPMALNTPDPPLAWGGGRWDVLDPEGRYMGTLVLPEGFRALRYRSGAIYGVGVDELGADRVVRIRLEEGA